MKLTPSTCPAGTRLIGKLDNFSTLIEVAIEEWSPGGLPKVKYASGFIGWMDSYQRGNFVVVEVLK